MSRLAVLRCAVLSALAVAVLGSCQPKRHGGDYVPEWTRDRVIRVTHRLADQIRDMQNPTPKVVTPMLVDFLYSNPDITGSAFAFAAEGDARQMYRVAPYIYRTGTALVHKELPTTYTFDSAWATWYRIPVESGKPAWSDPYNDVGGSGPDVRMVTFAVPVYHLDDPTRLLGVLTADVRVAPDAGN